MSLRTLRARRRRRAPLAAAAVAVVAALAAVVPAAPAPAEATASTSSYVGASTHTFWMSESDVRAELGTMAAGGVRWAREDFRWDVIEPSKGTFDWRRPDALMAGAAGAGVDVLAILTYSAKWASSDPSGSGNIHYPPKSNADYAAYARAVVARYGPGGTFWATRPNLTPRPLTAVEIWNEPWGHWFWRSGVDPVGYAAMAKAAAAAVKAANPAVRVLLSGDLLQVRTDGAIRPWLDEVLAADPGLVPLIDAYSVHPYPYPRQTSPLVDNADKRWDYGRIPLIRDVAAARGAAKPIWITELGWSTANTYDSVTEADQATFIRDAVVRAAAEWPYVERIFLYTWTKDRADQSDRESGYGLRRYDGSFKPSWRALTDAVAGLAAPTPTTSTTSTTSTTVGSTSPSPDSSTTTTTAPPKTKTPGHGRLKRLAGADRTATAALLSATTFDPGVDTAYVASAATFPDALAAGPLAAVRGGPVLLTSPGSLSAATATELARLQPRRIVVLGGPAAVADVVLSSLRPLSEAGVTRLAGVDRFETAAAISRTAFPDSGVPVAYVATGSAFPDALSGGALAARGPGPVLLTQRDTLPAATEAELRRLRPGAVVILGGPNAVSDDVLGVLSTLAAKAPVRLAGYDRFATSAAIGESSAAGGVAFVATGTDFPDALASVPVAEAADAPVLLVTRDAVPASVGDLLSRLRPSEIVVLGGPGAVSDAVAADLERYLAD